MVHIIWDKAEYLSTRPAINEATINGIIEELRSAPLAASHGLILANLILLCYRCALRAGEIIGMSVGDVYRKAEFSDVLKLSNDIRIIHLSSEDKAILEVHIWNLKSRGHKLYRSSPLFPNKKSKRYIPKLLRYDIRRACPNHSIRLSSIRQSGICRYYERLKASGIKPKNCLIQTAEFAGIKVYPKNLYPIVYRLKNVSPPFPKQFDD